MNEVKIGIIGAGNVGKGVLELLRDNGGLITGRAGVSIVVKKVCDKDRDKLDAVPELPGMEKCLDAKEVLDDREINIVVELIGGIQPAKDIILKALNDDKHVVTANKALLSEHWKEIFRVAADNGVFISFEGSVGGGIPIIRSIRESFISNKLELIYGILNGTTNFILSMMADEGYSFEKGLAMAQKKGIAETNPEMDLSGRDSAHKLAILSLIGFGIDVSHRDIFTEGIEKISPLDIMYAREWGYSIKLLAIAKRENGALQLRVHPTLLPSKHILANVKGEDNAIFVRGDYVGDALLFGKGAGARPTATSVVGDIVEIAKHVVFHEEEEAIKYEPLYAPGTIKILKEEDLEMAFYLRFSVIDRPGVLAGISSVLAENDISIARMSQAERKRGQKVPVVFMTHKAREGNMNRAIAVIDKMDFVTDATAAIRIEG